ncbi:MAG: hypothetical protein U0353_32075 [Sandaracinus sp.]
MQERPPGQTDELKGMAILALLGALGLGVLVLASALAGPPRGAHGGGPEEARGTEIGTLPPWLGGASRGTEAPGHRETPTGLGTHATGVAHEDDPQMAAFHQSYATAEDAGVAQPFSIAYHRGTLVSASGVAVHPGASCEVRVLPVRSYEFNCLVRVMCDDVVIYPDDAQRAGYAPCEIENSEAISAEDRSSTDGDREIDFDMHGRSVVVQEHVGDSEVLSARVVLES